MYMKAYILWRLDEMNKKDFRKNLYVKIEVESFSSFFDMGYLVILKCK